MESEIQKINSEKAKKERQKDRKIGWMEYKQKKIDKPQTGGRESVTNKRELQIDSWRIGEGP